MNIITLNFIRLLVKNDLVVYTLTINPTPYSFNGYYYRIEIKTPPGQGGCPFKSAPAILTVNPNAVINLSSAASTDAQTRCINTPINTGRCLQKVRKTQSLLQ